MICSLCGVDKSINEFHRNGTDKNGVERRRKDCIVCYNISRRLNSKNGKGSFKKFINNMKARTGEKAVLTLAEWKACLIYYGGECCYCGKKQSRSNKLTKDHVQPVVHGGKTEKYNTVPACIRCNSSKQEEQLEKWYHSQKFFSAERLHRIKRWVNAKNSN